MKLINFVILFTESTYREQEPTPPPSPSTPPEEDDIISATPEPATKHQRRRLINKSYMDSDGYVGKCTVFEKHISIFQHVL